MIDGCSWRDCDADATHTVRFGDDSTATYCGEHSLFAVDESLRQTGEPAFAFPGTERDGNADVIRGP